MVKDRGKSCYCRCHPLGSCSRTAYEECSRLNCLKPLEVCNDASVFFTHNLETKFVILITTSADGASWPSSRHSLKSDHKLKKSWDGDGSRYLVGWAEWVWSFDLLSLLPPLCKDFSLKRRVQSHLSVPLLSICLVLWVNSWGFWGLAKHHNSKMNYCRHRCNILQQKPNKSASGEIILILLIFWAYPVSEWDSW